MGQVDTRPVRGTTANAATGTGAPATLTFAAVASKWNAESHHAGRHRGHESPVKLARPEASRRYKVDKR